MIISKTWLNEFIDISKKSLAELSATLNSIGLEVDSTKSLRVPDKIVVGFVKEKSKVENSDKLNLCKVDVGSEVLDIVCGASNVEAGQFVAVALEDALMPSGLVIKKAKLRGVQSCGMICSSTELGLAKINDGIMVLDESIGTLELGKALNEYELFNDELIEVELTPNRGDCLSIYGIARDLAAAFSMDLKKQENFIENEKALGIGRILRIHADKNLNGAFIYRIIELKDEVKLDLLSKLRLASIEELEKNDIQNILNYATHASGVLFNAYDLKSECKIALKISKGTHGESKVIYKDECLSVSGIYTKPSLDKNSRLIIIEANYTKPCIIAEAKNAYKEQDAKMLYRSFRGSEPRLALGMDYLLSYLLKFQDISIYSGSQQNLYNPQAIELTFTALEVSMLVGKDIDRNTISSILKNLGFEINLIDENLISAKVPLYRSDISNFADVCEEIVRIIGIDNIPSKALEFTECKRLNKTYFEYLNLLELRKKAVANGYFESVHYVLDSKEELHKLGFKSPSLKLVNPLNSELDTLRSTLINHLLNALSFNAKNSQKSIKLFESGMVFDEEANERTNFALVFSGLKEEAKIANKAKPELVDFYTFLLELKNIIGDFELKNSNLSFLSPYEQANVYKNGQNIGFVGRLHCAIEDEKDLSKTYLSELDLQALKPDFKKAKNISKFPQSSRDLSILIPKGFEYEKIKTCIENLKLKNLKSFRVVDLYSDESLKEHFSLTINLVFQDEDKTLEDSEVGIYIEQIIGSLKEKLNLDLR